MNIDKLIAELLCLADIHDARARNTQDTITNAVHYALAAHTRELAELIQDAADNDE